MSSSRGNRTLNVFLSLALSLQSVQHLVTGHEKQQETTAKLETSFPFVSGFLLKLRKKVKDDGIDDDDD